VKLSQQRIPFRETCRKNCSVSFMDDFYHEAAQSYYRRKAQICWSLEGQEKGKKTTIKIRHMLLSFLFRGFWRIF